MDYYVPEILMALAVFGFAVYVGVIVCIVKRGIEDPEY